MDSHAQERDPSEAARTAELLARLASLRGACCHRCAAPLCGHAALMSLVMGFQEQPYCGVCLAQALQRGFQELRDSLRSFIASRQCYAAGWAWANLQEGFSDDALPSCLWNKADPGKEQPATPNPFPEAEAAASAAQPLYEEEWDAGPMACGDLLVQLRIRLRSLSPGKVLKLTAHDPGAREDLPAWCRLTGHTLLASQHPVYWIRRKEN